MDVKPKTTLVEGLVKTVEDISAIPEFRNAYKKLFFNLARRIKLLVPMFEELRESKEEVSEKMVDAVLVPLGKALESAKELLRLGSEGSRISLVLERDKIMKWFQEVTNQLEQSLADISFDELDISDEVREQVELVYAQLKRAKERVDDAADLELYDNLVSVYNTKIDAEVDPSVLQGLAEKLQLVTISDLTQESLALHDMVLAKGGDPGEEIEKMSMLLKKIKDYMQTQNLAMGIPTNNKQTSKEAQKNLVIQDQLLDSSETATSAVIPDDFRCPITLELMRDPVIVSTGQTYDRGSIEKWLGSGHDTCPKTQQKLSSKSLTPNYVLRSLIADWCKVNGIDIPAHYGPDSENQSNCTASEHAKVVELLDKLLSQNLGEQQSAAAEIRLLARANSENRICIAEAGGIPRLVSLLYTPDVQTQEHVVTAILNLSIFDQNKARIISASALPGIVHVLKMGSMSARENAAATLFSLSVVDRIKVAIGEAGAIPPLVLLLREGGQRGKKDAATALFNLCIYQGNKRRAVRAALVPVLVELISDPEGALKDEALAILAILSSHPEGKAAITATEALPLLVEVIKSGSPRNKENAAAVLLHLCQGQHHQQPMAKATDLGILGLLQEMMETGTDRGKRKAGQLLELFSNFIEKQESQCLALAEAQSEQLPAAL